MRHALWLAFLLAAPTASAQMPAGWIEHPMNVPFPMIWTITCGDTAAFVAGAHGEVARFDGSRWTLLAPVPSAGHNMGANFASDSAGRAVFTTSNDAIFHFAGGRWEIVPAPIGDHQPRQLVSFDGVHAVTVGRGRVVAWNGGAYAAYDGGTSDFIEAIWGRADDDLWIGGGGGYVARFDGRRLVTHAIATTGGVVSLWGAASDDVWAVTHAPLLRIFHWDGRRWSDRTGPFEAQYEISLGGRGQRVFATAAVGVFEWADDRWQAVVQLQAEPSDMRYAGVCATRTRVLVAERDRRVWALPLGP